MTIEEEFFEWIYQLVDGKKYRTMLETLYGIEFFNVVNLDGNRIFDGVNLRYAFCKEAGIPKRVMDKKLDNTTCSVLEMMVGLALRAEETIMSDEDFGDRTSMWFWIMIKSLGLYDQTDDKIDKEYVTHTISRFLHRDYEYNGSGGLFTIANPEQDMRDVEIWYQMCLFFNSIL